MAKRGRKPKFASVEELQTKIDGYFAHCDTTDEIPDVEGLALYLDTTRKTLYEYQQQPEYGDVLERAKDRIFWRKKQMAFAGRLNPTVFIFDAKNNHGYKDRVDIDQTIGQAKAFEVNIRIID